MESAAAIPMSSSNWQILTDRPWELVKWEGISMVSELAEVRICLSASDISCMESLDNSEEEF